jgi:hypothetical protein
MSRPSERRMTRFCVMAAQVLAILTASAAVGPTFAADVKTGKERLTDKASDEQRVDDCKVAQARRTRPRPTTCAAGAGG